MTVRRMLIAALVGYVVTLVLWVIVGSADATLDAGGVISEPISRLPFTALIVVGGITFLVSTALVIAGAVVWLTSRPRS
ncbi:MAG: hypothetical protein O2815_12120 [Actinomycetota bacterium]|nr:hypothetical protein [Actinomycetota bacterium]